MVSMSWFRKSSNKQTLAWKTLTSEAQFLELVQQEELFAVFKHSTRCSISSMALNRLESAWDINIPLYYLDLLAERAVSNLIEDHLGIQHQSPQLIIIHRGKVVYHASHSAIQMNAIREAVADLVEAQ